MGTAPRFDIFYGVPDRDAVWICSAQGQANAQEEMDRIAVEKPGPYFVFSAATHEVVARIDTSRPLRVVLRHSQLYAALDVLRKVGHSVGEFSLNDEEPLVAIDGESLTHEQIFQMVEAYKGRRTA